MIFFSRSLIFLFNRRNRILFQLIKRSTKENVQKYSISFIFCKWIFFFLRLSHFYLLIRFISNTVYLFSYIHHWDIQRAVIPVFIVQFFPREQKWTNKNIDELFLTVCVHVDTITYFETASSRAREGKDGRREVGYESKDGPGQGHWEIFFQRNSGRSCPVKKASNVQTFKFVKGIFVLFNKAICTKGVPRQSMKMIIPIKHGRRGQNWINFIQL